MLRLITSIRRPSHTVRLRNLRRRQRLTAAARFESLEARALLASYTVTNLLDAGTGSLRDAMIEANTNPGADEITFSVAGTIQLTSALPTITDTVTIDGSTAPGFASTPVITVDFAGETGLVLTGSSVGSTLRSLSIVAADGPGVSLFSGSHVLEGNFIGVLADGATASANTGAGVVIGSMSADNQIGTTAAGNLISGNAMQGILIYGDNNTVASNLIGTTLDGTAALPNGSDGIRLVPGASGNLIGNDDPVASIDSYSSDAVALPVQTWTGIRQRPNGEYLITGTTQAGGNESGLLYVGALDGTTTGSTYAINYPGGVGTATTVYGPDLLVSPDGQITDDVRLVGTYVLDGDPNRYAFSFRGNLNTMAADALDPSNYTTISIAAPITFLHSTMGGLAVGTYASSDAPDSADNAFVYDFTTGEFTSIVFPGSVSNTAYGIWDNGKGSFTICGGFAQQPINNSADPLQPIGMASLVDYDHLTGAFSNWRAFSFAGDDRSSSPVTHFQGISSVEKGVYTLAGTALVPGSGLVSGLASVTRNTDGSFGDMSWATLDPAVPVTGEAGQASANSVYGNAVVGVIVGGSGEASYQAEVNVAFQLSNVISGNAGNGVTVIGSHANVISMNQIGTDVSGTVALPNAANGVLLTRGASGNLLGGAATGGNNPTAGVFVRPPQGNLISSNAGNGVAIQGGARNNTLSGNFVGTTASGNEPLGNRRDGVAIAGANNNTLLGTTFQQSPFVFYNVLSGNGGNGLRITSANTTTVQANFFGAGANNFDAVPNGGSGILANGTSSGIQAGGVIPMGNVTSGNNAHGIDVADQVSGFVSFNNFAGMAAFGGAIPNRLNGFQITATGGNNLVRTCLPGGNLGNGIVIGGDASGVTVEDTAAGTNYGINGVLPNGGSGIVITGTAHNNVIGGFQPSVETKVHMSGNLRYGIEVRGNAYDNHIFNTVVGAGFRANEPLPNALGGIFIGQGTSGTVIGGSQPFMANRVLFNGGPGITLGKTSNTIVVGNVIRENVGDGLWINRGRENLIGLPSLGNEILANGGNGIRVAGDTEGSMITANRITASGVNGIQLTAAGNLSIGELPLNEFFERFSFLGYVAPQASGNVIVTSVGYGLLASGACTGTSVIRNTILQNGLGNVDLTTASGITYVP